MSTAIKESTEVVSVTAGHGIDNSPYKIFTDKATMESLFSLHFVRLTEQNSKILRTNEKILCLELDNGSHAIESSLFAVFSLKRLIKLSD